jgi:hypothetical protein
MDVFEITGFRTGLDHSGVNFIDPIDAFDNIQNGYIYRQELLSRFGFSQFSLSKLPAQVAGQTRVMGIFIDILPDSTQELLVFDLNYLYKYNPATDLFVKVPFASANPIAALAISDPAYYVTGTSYFTKAGHRRFVFTSKGMTDIFFYNGTNVKRFTNLVDNPDYQAPALGVLTNADKIFWFGERLNLFNPTIGGLDQPQSVLYSGIRNSSGTGDKFNSVGSGLLNANTYDLMKGAIIFGDIIIMTFQNSYWALEKTRDVFNPYFIRKIPSVIGTDAPFSSVQWASEIKSIGRSGLSTTDGRQAMRFDNKLPYFTNANVDPVFFDYIYGGFERNLDQFMFTYRDAHSDLADQTQDSVLIYNYKEDTWSINKQRFTVFGESTAGTNLVWNDIYEANNPSWKKWKNTSDLWNEVGIFQDVVKSLAGDNDGFVYQINTDLDDYNYDITNITQAAQAVATVTTSAFKKGDKVIFKDVEGMTEINDLIATVVSSTPTTITVDIDSSLFTAYTGDGLVSKVIEFDVLFNPFNPYRSQGRQVYISHIDFLVNTDSQPINVEISADEEDFAFKTSQIIPDNDSEKARQWISVPVNNEANFMTLNVYADCHDTRTIITSVRVYCKPGALTNG